MRANSALLTLLVCIAPIVCAAPVQAQFFLSLGGGLSTGIAPDDLKDLYPSGFAVRGGAGYSFSPTSALLVELEYSKHSLDEAELLRQAGTGFVPNISGGELSVIGVNTLYQFTFPSKGVIGAHLIAGLGYHKAKLETVVISIGVLGDTVPGEDESNLAALVGLGLDIAASSNIEFFIQARTQMMVIQDADNFLFLPLLAGVRIKT